MNILTIMAVMSVVNFATPAETQLPQLSAEGHNVCELTASEVAVNSVTRAAAPTIITAPPADAEETLMQRNAAGYYLVAGRADTSIDYGMSLKLYSEGDDIYFYKPIHMAPGYSFLKGRKTAKTMTFSLPQALTKQYDNNTKQDMYYSARILKFNKQAQWYYIDEDATELVLVLDENGKYSFDNEGYTTITNTASGNSTDFPNKILGLVDEYGEWSGYGDSTIELLPFTENWPEIPAGLQTETYNMLYGHTGKEIQIAFKGDDVYALGFSSYLPGSWVIGKIVDNQVLFPSQQYMGISNYMDYLCYFDALEVKQFVENGVQMIDVSVLPNAVFDYDAEKKTLTAQTDVCVCGGPLARKYLEFYEKPVIKSPIEEFNPKPKTPEFVNWVNAKGEDPGQLYVQIPNVSVSDHLLNASKMEWALYIDGDTFILDPSDYLKLKEPLEWIPYYFFDGFDITYSGALHSLYFFVEVPETLGIISRYMDENGDYHYSDPAEVDPNNPPVLEPNGVETPRADVVGEDYFNLQGQRVDKGYKGVAVVVKRFADGKKRVYKQLGK